MPKPVLPPTPPKRANPLLDIRSAVATGNYRLTSHAEKRMAERSVILSEVIQILDRGFCEPRKDEFKREKGGWNYAIRGKTLDRRELRVCVAFDDSAAIVVTVVDLDARGDVS